MNANPTRRNECSICTAETEERYDAFCTTCQTQVELALYRLGAEGSAVMVPVRVN